MSATPLDVLTLRRGCAQCTLQQLCLPAGIGREELERLDEIVKRKLYERFGVDEYWIVDPAIDTVKIYRRIGGAFVRTAEISSETGGRITTPLLPGFTLDVAVIFDL